MYSTCLFCNQPLGTNEALEAFPVGRRVAFDGAKGRLWVVCRKCERWNLSPLEERWEVVESCERLFRETRTRVSTENIGLARLREGLELVRIGPALRPEFAAWRYGDQFGRRRRRAILYGAGGVAVYGAFAFGTIFAGAVGSVLLSGSNLVNMFASGRTLTLVKLRSANGQVIKLKKVDLVETGIAPPGTGADHWRVVVGRTGSRHVFEGAEAERIAGLIAPGLNRWGGGRSTVRNAVRQIETAGGPEGFIQSETLDPRRALHWGASRQARKAELWSPDGEPLVGVAKLPRPARLALEMTLHEEQERRALAGELKALELAWREAEEIAAIADSLLPAAGAEEFMERHRAPGEAVPASATLRGEARQQPERDDARRRSRARG